MWVIWLLLMLETTSVRSQTCPACPANGIWSDWTSTETCEEPCGSCSSRTYTRTCLSTSMAPSCPCNGVTSKRMVCNTQACNFPRFNATGDACCTGTPKTINSWVYCVPLPDNYTLPCCPTGGYWSGWSGWSKVSNQNSWQRSRTCLSGGYNCPCSGDSVFITNICPCTPMKVITDATNTCTKGTDHDNPFSVRTPFFLASQCQVLIVLEASNFRQNFYTVNAVNSKAESSIGWIDSSGTCRQSTYQIDGSAASYVGTNGQLLKSYLDCNLNTLLFEGTVQGVSMSNVVAFAQYY